MAEIKLSYLFNLTNALFITILGLPLVPFTLIIFNFSWSFYFYTYKLRNYNEFLTKSAREFWNRPYTYVIKQWQFFGRLVHGYELEGIENIPLNGPAIIVSYHAAIPIDAGFVVSKIFLKTNRKLVTVIDKMASNFPGYQSFLEALEHGPFDYDTCLSYLRKGDLLFIYPGGIKEMILSDNDYKVVWKENPGFARLAVEAKIPVIPLFTKNTREIYGCMNYFKDFFRNLYKTKKIAYFPIYGYFPVKLKTYVGKPILYESSRSSTELASLVKQSLEEIIAKHQRIPGNILSSIIERFIPNKED